MIFKVLKIGISKSNPRLSNSKGLYFRQESIKLNFASQSLKKNIRLSNVREIDLPPPTLNESIRNSYQVIKKPPFHFE